MKNGIIINGVKYEAVESKVEYGCEGCDFAGDDKRPCTLSSIGSVCTIFGSNAIFVKHKDQEK